MSTLEQLQQYDYIFTENNNPIMYLLRLLGWGVIWLLQSIIEAMENVMKTLFNNLTFYNSDEMTGLFTSLNPVIWTLLIIGVLILGYNLMFNKLKGKSQIPVNLIAFALIATSLPTFMNIFADLTKSSVDSFGYSSSGSSISQQIISSCVEDLLFYDKHNFSDIALAQKNNISSDKTSSLNPIEIVKPSTTNNKDLFSNKLTVDPNGEYTLSQLEDGFFDWDMFSSYYYRYKIDWLTLFIALIAMVFALVFSSLKIAKLIFELGFNSIFLLFVAPLDLSVGQRIKKSVMEILNIFLVVICISLIFRIYIYGITWASATFSGLTLAIALLGFSWGLIDGPNIVQKILGIDAGLSSGGTFLSQLYHGGKMAKDVASGVASVPKNVSASINNGISSAKQNINKASNFAGKMSGIYDHYKDNKGSDDTKNSAEYGFNRKNLFEEDRISPSEQTNRLSDNNDDKSNNINLDDNLSADTSTENINNDNIPNESKNHIIDNVDTSSADLENNKNDNTQAKDEKKDVNANQKDSQNTVNSDKNIDSSRSSDDRSEPIHTFNEDNSNKFNNDTKKTAPHDTKNKESSDKLNFNSHSKSNNNINSQPTNQNQTLGSYVKGNIKNSMIGKSFDIGKTTATKNISQRHDNFNEISNATKNSLNNVTDKINSYDNFNSADIYTDKNSKAYTNTPTPDIHREKLSKPSLFKRRKK